MTSSKNKKKEFIYAICQIKSEQQKIFFLQVCWFFQKVIFYYSNWTVWYVSNFKFIIFCFYL